MSQQQIQFAELHIAIKKYKSGSYGTKPIAPKTLKNRRIFLFQLETFLGGKPFCDESARAFLDSLRTRKRDGTPAKPSTISQMIAKLRALCAFLIEEGILEKNFAKKIPRPSEEETRAEIVLLDPKIIAKAIMLGTTPGKGDRARSKRSKADSRVVLQFIQVTGRRKQEVLGMSGSDLNLDGDPPTYWVTLKGGRRQLFEIPPIPILLEALRKRKDKQKLFSVSGETMIKHMRDGLRKMGIEEKIINHHLRHMFAIERLSRGESTHHVSRLLGQTNTATAEKYYLPYVVTNYSAALRNSTVIRHGQTIIEILREFEKTNRERLRDDRFGMPTGSFDVEKQEYVFKIPLTKLGLVELQKTQR